MFCTQSCKAQLCIYLLLPLDAKPFPFTCKACPKKDKLISKALVECTLQIHFTFPVPFLCRRVQCYALQHAGLGLQSFYIFFLGTRANLLSEGKRSSSEGALQSLRFAKHANLWFAKHANLLSEGKRSSSEGALQSLRFAKDEFCTGANCSFKQN